MGIGRGKISIIILVILSMIDVFLFSGQTTKTWSFIFFSFWLLYILLDNIGNVHLLLQEQATAIERLENKIERLESKLNNMDDILRAVYHRTSQKDFHF